MAGRAIKSRNFLSARRASVRTISRRDQGKGGGELTLAKDEGGLAGLRVLLVLFAGHAAGEQIGLAEALLVDLVRFCLVVFGVVVHCGEVVGPGVVPLPREADGGLDDLERLVRDGFLDRVDLVVVGAARRADLVEFAHLFADVLPAEVGAESVQASAVVADEEDEVLDLDGLCVPAGGLRAGLEDELLHVVADDVLDVLDEGVVGFADGAEGEEHHGNLRVVDMPRLGGLRERGDHRHGRVRLGSSLPIVECKW